MPRRPYSMERRTALETKTRERIVRATVALHAEHGASATSYAMIAKRAQVAPQTVYNHFPDLPALLGACTGHVHGKAPEVGTESFRAGRSPEARVRLLAEAVFAKHAFMAPWLRWHEAAVIPELGALKARGDAALRDLVGAAIAPERAPTPAFLDAALVLLSFPAWQQLTQGRASPEAARIAGDCLADLLPRLTHLPDRKEAS